MMKNLTQHLKDEFNLDLEERREAIESFETEKDFEVGDYRFISHEDINEIMKEELLSDKYTLGCFSAWFISDITGLDMDAVEKAQAESFELLGELMSKHIEQVVTDYVAHDGYGHYFAHYDGEEHDLESYGVKYYAFRT